MDNLIKNIIENNCKKMEGISERVELNELSDMKSKGKVISEKDIKKMMYLERRLVELRKNLDELTLLNSSSPRETVLSLVIKKEIESDSIELEKLKKRSESSTTSNDTKD